MGDVICLTGISATFDIKNEACWQAPAVKSIAQARVLLSKRASD